MMIQKRSKTEILDVITKQFLCFEEFAIDDSHDQIKLLSSIKLMIKCQVMNLPTKISRKRKELPSMKTRERNTKLRTKPIWL